MVNPVVGVVNPVGPLSDLDALAWTGVVILVVPLSGRTYHAVSVDRGCHLVVPLSGWTYHVDSICRGGPVVPLSGLDAPRGWRGQVDIFPVYNMDLQEL